MIRLWSSYTLSGCSGTVVPFSITSSATDRMELSSCRSRALVMDWRLRWTLLEACSHQTVASVRSWDLDEASSLSALEALQGVNKMGRCNSSDCNQVTKFLLVAKDSSLSREYV